MREHTDIHSYRERERERERERKESDMIPNALHKPFYTVMRDFEIVTIEYFTPSFPDFAFFPEIHFFLFSLFLLLTEAFLLLVAGPNDTHM